jgi:hypothetical protein
MDAIDILGGLLGRRSKRPSGGGGGGTDILKDIFSRGSRPAPRTGGDSSTSPTDLKRQAEELEDLLNVSNDRHATRTAQPPQSSPQRPPAGTGFPAPGPAPRREEPRTPQSPSGSASRQNDEALVLVRAMVNAAKADGQVTPAEQQAILEQMGGAAPDTLQFLRQEFAKPLNVREFAWSVPPGMEQKVYAMSLMAIDSESPQTTQYLQELAHGLRLTDDVCRQIRARYSRP